MEPLSHHRIFSSEDVDEASLFASRIWERNRTRITDGCYGLRWNRLEFGRVSLDYVQHDCTVDLRAEGPLSDRFRYFLHDDGWMEHRTGRRRRLLSTTDNVVVHSPGIELQSTLGPARFVLVGLDGEFVRHAVAQRFRKLPTYGDWPGELPRSANLQALRSFSAWLVTEVDTPGSLLADSPNSRRHAERLLLSLFVECLTETIPQADDSIRDISLAQVRKAQAWIDANLHEPIGVEEMASAAGVGVRSLQFSFKRVLGCSPRAFLLRRRLEVARQRLLAGGEASVTSVATTLGFFELGRFSQRYRQHFGESPSATLARSHLRRAHAS
jgi:AraC-like DNA-binding protein